jgi:hypothetical protein
MVDLQAKTIEMLQEDVWNLHAKLRKAEDALRAIVDEEVPRGVETPYRDDGIPSKHDRCAHHEWMYNYCPYCIMEYAEKKLEELK